MPLTTKQIEKLQPQDKRYVVNDTHGLTLRVYPSGTKTWVLRLCSYSRVTDVTLGRYPEVSLKGARQLARRKHKELGMEAPAGYILRDAYRLWKNLKRGRIKSYMDECRRIERYLMKTLGNRQIDEITAPLVIYTVSALDKQNKRPTLKRVLMRLNEMMELSVCAGFIQHNPLSKVSKVFAPAKTKPMPSLPWKETEWVMRVMKNATPKTKLFFLWSIASALRPCENAKLRWDWIEDDVLVISSSEMKKGREHRVPLTDFMKAILAECKKLSGRSKYIFTGRTGSTHISSQCLSKYLHQTELSGKLVAHGLRSMARSWMADQSVGFEIAEACLSHVVGSNVSRAYQRSDYLEQRVVVMNDWNQYVLDCARKAEILKVNDCNQIDFCLNWG